jgi:hypothetical protein
MTIQGAECKTALLTEPMRLSMSRWSHPADAANARNVRTAAPKAIELRDPRLILRLLVCTLLVNIAGFLGAKHNDLFMTCEDFAVVKGVASAKADLTPIDQSENP